MEKLALPLEGNKDLYERYNLLNKKGKIKVVSYEKGLDWLKSLNRSPYHTFKLSNTPVGYKIFITS